MTLYIHPIHRRLAELSLKARKVKGWARLSREDQVELEHCLKANADLVIHLDQLKNLAYELYLLGQMDWQQDVCNDLEALEGTML